MNIAILGCGHIAHRIAMGIIYSHGNLYAAAARDIERARQFARQYKIEHAYTYEQCLADEQIDLIYIAAANPAHYELTKKCLEHHKNVLCEKPFLKDSLQIKECFELARKNHCFLMEAHKTCFTPLNVQLKEQLHEIGSLKEIHASYCMEIGLDTLSKWNVEPEMGGAFYDVGVYPIIFAHYYSDSKITESKFDVKKQEGYDCDLEGSCKLIYENGVSAYLKTSWLHEEINRGILIGEKGSIIIENFWKNTSAVIEIGHHRKKINVEQSSDFTGEINHAIDCIEKGWTESPIMSENASLAVSALLEEMKRQRG